MKHTLPSTSAVAVRQPVNHPLLKMALDVHLAWHVVAMQEDGASPKPPQRFKPADFLKWIEQKVATGARVVTCYEAGPFGYGLHRQLTALGVTNYVIRPRDWDDHHTRVKTDRTDALAMLNGNMRTNGTRLFDYDDENELIRITEPGAWKSEFVYDGKMRRRIETNFVWQGGSWVVSGVTRFIYDGNVVLQERDGNNLPQVTYTRGNDQSGSLQGAGGIGGLLARTDNSATLSYPPSTFSTAFYHTDGNGNVTCLIHTNQTIAAKYLYDPYGNTLSACGPLAIANRLRFSNKPIHELSGMYDYLYRWYVPNLQRWPTVDPREDIGFRIITEAIHNGSVDDINLYSFVGNTPPNVADPLGLANISLNVNWGPNLRTTANRSRLQKNMDRLRTYITKCCADFKIGCGNTVSASQGGSGGTPVNMTDQPFTDPKTIARGRQGGEVTWRIGMPGPSDNVLSHELGHVGGYRGPDGGYESLTGNDLYHSHDPENLMFPTDERGSNVDKCYCESLAKLAK